MAISQELEYELLIAVAREVVALESNPSFRACHGQRQRDAVMQLRHLLTVYDAREVPSHPRPLSIVGDVTLH